MKRINTEVSFRDARGEITDLIEKENINAVTLISFSKGAVRGNHYHKQTTQWNYVISGQIKLASQVPSESIVETVMEPGDLTVTGPNDRHALVALEDSKVLVFTKGPRGGKEYESDTFRLKEPLVTV